MTGYYESVKNRFCYVQIADIENNYERQSLAGD